MKTKTKELPKWFGGTHYSNGETVTNPFSGESFYLDRTELSMYDFIKGAEYVIEMKGGPFSEKSTVIQREMIKGLDWFRRNNAKAYMVLLD
jgi:hypothetical protein